MKYPVIPSDYVVVKVAKEFADTIEYGKLKLKIGVGFNDNGMNRAHYVAKEGTVVSIPLAMRRHKHIVPEVEVGDVIHFHYNSIQDSTKITTEDGEVFYKIDYDMIMVAVRRMRSINKPYKIVPIGGTVLTEAVEEAPDGFKIEELDLHGTGKMIRCLTKGGIVVKVNPTSHSLQKAKVAYIGTPLTYAPDLGLKSGDIVLYEKNADFGNHGDKILGKNYFLMFQDELMAKQL